MECCLNQKRPVKISAILYVIMGLWVLAFMLSTSMLSVYSLINIVLGATFIAIRLILVIFAVVDCLINGIKKKKIFYLAIFTAITIVEYIVADNWLLFELFFIFLFWGETLDYKKTLKIFMIVTLFSILLIAGINSIGLLPKYEYYTTRMVRQRVTLGFHHPNALSECLMVVIFCAFLLCNSKLKNGVVLLLSSITVLWIAIYPNTLTVVITVFLVFIIYYFLNFRLALKVLSNKLFLIVALSTILGVAFLYYVVISGKFNDSPIFQSLESLYIRIRLSKEGINRYGITLLGTVYESYTEIAVNILKTANEYFTIDCLYFLLPIRYGIVSTIVFFICYFYSIYISIKKCNIKLLSILLSVLIMSVVDSFVTNYIMSFVFICAKAYRPHFAIDRESDSV